MEGVEKVEQTHGNHAHHFDPVVEYQSLKLGMWLFIATELLLFGGLFAAYTIYRAKYPDMFAEQHLELNKPLGALNTAVLLLSSLTMALGVTSIQRGKPKRLAFFLLLTIVLGLAFGVNKYIEYSAKFHHHIYPGTSIFFSLYFMMTGLHMLHVFAGISILTTMLVLTLRGKFSDKYYTPVEVSGLYWHLVDLIWIYLFPLLYLIA
ncbi:MAG TPA: cytochrome c oxidase subunit 3 family protein [Thermodesulfobacteriota bacterium]|jgi:cytochrome c oxidase subunit 3